MSLLPRLARPRAILPLPLPRLLHRHTHNLSHKFLRYVRLSPEIRDALEHRAPVVALDSAILSHPLLTHGLLYPDNIEYAARAEQTIRMGGAIPATIAVVNGLVHVGLMSAFFAQLGDQNSSKISRRDLPYVLGMGFRNGGCTVAATMAIASLVGIKVLATSGIGGVHRAASLMLDISADVAELGRSNVAVVCSGFKPYLDVPWSVEYLETRGVPVLTFCPPEAPAFRLEQTPNSDQQRQQEEGRQQEGGRQQQAAAAEDPTVMLPAFYCRADSTKSPHTLTTVLEAAHLIHSSHALSLTTGALICNPVPRPYELELTAVKRATKSVFKIARRKNKRDKEDIKHISFMIRKHSSQGGSANATLAERAILLGNARLAASIAVEVSKLDGGPGRVETPIRPLPVSHLKEKHWRQRPLESDANQTGGLINTGSEGYRLPPESIPEMVIRREGLVKGRGRSEGRGQREGKKLPNYKRKIAEKAEKARARAEARAGDTRNRAWGGPKPVGHRRG